VTLDELNVMPHDAAERKLAKCCGSSRWTAAMAGRRPFQDAEHVYRDAQEIWWSLDGGDWLEAFAHHPRIGARAGMWGWAKDEQAGTQTASADTMQRLAERNHEYERKFGHVFLIFASGKRADEMLAQLELRIANDPAAELRIAAGEQAKITRLRLEKLLSPARATSRTE
jgi:2-oxo-4-hydroxy-4-carboxy-5-ureidoimidazoline decarboxylase